MADTKNAPAAAAKKGSPKVKHPRFAGKKNCSVASCKRPYRAKGFCVTHYKLWRAGEVATSKPRYKICTKEACKKARFAGSLCKDHHEADVAARKLKRGEKPAVAAAAPAPAAS